VETGPKTLPLFQDLQSRKVREQVETDDTILTCSCILVGRVRWDSVIGNTECERRSCSLKLKPDDTNCILPATLNWAPALPFPTHFQIKGGAFATKLIELVHPSVPI